MDLEELKNMAKLPYSNCIINECGNVFTLYEFLEIIKKYPIKFYNMIGFEFS